MARLIRLVGAVSLVTLGVWLSAAGVLAAGNPDRQPLPNPPDVSGPFCGDAIGIVLAHVEVNREYIKTLTSSGDVTRLQVNGFEATSVSAGRKTLTFNASGPATIMFGPGDTVTIAGRGHSFAINPYGPNTGIIVFTGLITVDGNTGNVTSSIGHQTDVCTLLAA
jgi:hypothetical protein